MDCDIVIPIWNALRETQECIVSIRVNTDLNYRLILVDNGSEEETRRYLEGLAESNDVRVIRNNKNLGFVKAVNQGIAISNTPYVCILNNDTIVTDGWLKELIRIAESDKNIGVVNPASNNLGYKVPKGISIDEFAKDLEGQKGKFIELSAAIGFCMLIKRTVIDKIGGFDEIFGMGNFEDTDFSRRTQKAGFLCVCAKGAYVYHKQNVSFLKRRHYDSEFIKNMEIFNQRWGKSKRIAVFVNRMALENFERLKGGFIDSVRRGDWLYLYKARDVGNLNLIEHAGIKEYVIPKRFFKIFALFKIIWRRKKPFDEVYKL